MEHNILGLVILASATVAYFIAIKRYNQAEVKTALLLIVLGGLALRMFACSDDYLHSWDERYHALVAKNVMTHPLQPTLYEDPILAYDYRDWGANNTWLHKQPLPLWAMATSMAVFGVNEYALRLPSLILSTLGIWLTFLIGRHFYDDKVGLLAAFLFSMYMAILFFRENRLVYNLLCGVLVGAAILCKWLPALIVLPLWILLAIEAENKLTAKVIGQFTLLCLMVVLVALPWQLYTFNQYPLEAAWESQYNLRHFNEVIEGHGRPIYYHFHKLMVHCGELIFLPLIWFFVKSIRRVQAKRLVLLTWVLVPLIFFTLAETKLKAYTLFTSPAVFIIAAVFWRHLYRFRKKFNYQWVIKLVLFLLIALPVRYAIERIKPFAPQDESLKWSAELTALENAMAGKENCVVFQSEDPIESMFYTNCTAYSTIPSTSFLDSLASVGYHVLVREKTKTEPLAKKNDNTVSYRSWSIPKD